MPILGSSVQQQIKILRQKYRQMGIHLSGWVENIVEKGEIARYEQFLLFLQCFSKAVYCSCVKMSIYGVTGQKTVSKKGYRSRCTKRVHMKDKPKINMTYSRTKSQALPKKGLKINKHYSSTFIIFTVYNIRVYLFRYFFSTPVMLWSAWGDCKMFVAVNARNLMAFSETQS